MNVCIKFHGSVSDVVVTFHSKWNTFNLMVALEEKSEDHQSH